MNPPTDRERPALSEADRALIETARCLKRGDYGARDDGWLIAQFNKADDRIEVLASPKPSITQGGVVELAEKGRDLVRRWKRPGHTISGHEASKLIGDLATALERLAGERGGEADHDAVDGVAEVLFEQRQTGWMWAAAVEADLDTEYGQLVDIVRDDARAVLKFLAHQPLPVEVERERIEGIVRTALLNVHGIDDLKFSERVKELTRLSSEAADAILTAHPALGGGGR